MKVISTEKSQVLASKVAANLRIGISYTKFEKFPDGELYLKAEKPDAETVIIGSITDSDSFIQLLLLIDACEGSDITLVLPYMGYARQDRKFNDGEPVSGRAIAKALSGGINRVITVNIHEDAILDFFSVPAKNLSLASEIGRFLSTLGLDKPLILAPDAGAAGFAAGVADTYGWETDHLKKTRISGMEVQIKPQKLDVAGREVVIVDDIISTGGTLATAAEMLREQGATKIHAACVHGVFASGGYARLCSAGFSSVTSADTIESGSSQVSAAELIAEAIRNQ